MLSLTVFFTVIAAAAISISDVQGKSLQGVDIQNILQSLQQQLQKEQLQQLVTDQVVRLDDNDDDDDDDDDNNRYGSLKSHEVEELIRLASNDREDNDLKNDKKRERNRYKDNDDSDRKSPLDEQLLEQLQFLQDRQDKPPSFKTRNKGKKQYVQPNDLLGSGYDREESGESNGYSNVYLILNPDAVEKSKNRDKLAELLSNLLSSPQRNKRDRKDRKREHRYKGFVLKDNNILARRNRGGESKEIYEPRNSVERDYKPKRSRGDRGGGGGGGGSGRTAIPYIRHHGDIYERDN